jgi:CCR4-NOT transcription complex subunit 6
MSRNHKDKYENTNPRRAHTIMSSEDAAAGKKSHWPELEITGKEKLHQFVGFKSLKLSNSQYSCFISCMIRRQTIFNILG